MNDELKQIKKIYGEEMMHLSRELFSGILEKEGTLLHILEKHLAPNRMFAREIISNDLKSEFKNWIYSYVDITKRDYVVTDKNPFELMDMAGYKLYECKTEEDIQSFKKYYKNNEVICTIKNGDRLKRCYVFFAVKKNVDSIKRENFLNPERQDEYGTSVISIQFDRGKNNILSIKNRYNHTVEYPDSTFSNNLENIIPGLTYSFYDNYGFNIIREEKDSADFLYRDLKYVKGSDNKFYRYNANINGIYYCANNMIVGLGGNVDLYAKEKEKYLVIDQYIVDLRYKTISPFIKSSDSFTDSINSVGKIKNINVLKDGLNRIVEFIYDDQKSVKITIDGNNAIIGYDNIYVTMLGDDFLRYNSDLVSLNVPNVVFIGNSFLALNKEMRRAWFPNVKEVGNDFLYFHEQLEELYMPAVESLGKNFLAYNKALTSISLPNVEYIGDYFLCNNTKLNSISIPKVKDIGDGFMFSNTDLPSISIPEIQTHGQGFLNSNYNVEIHDRKIK